MTPPDAGRPAARRRRALEKHLGPISCAIGLAIVIALYALRQPLILSPFGLASLANVSVPLALAEVAVEGRLPPGEPIWLVAFGAGLPWGGALLRWGPTAAAVDDPAAVGEHSRRIAEENS